MLQVPVQNLPKRYQKSSKESMLAWLWSKRSAWRSMHNRRCHGLRLVNRGSFLRSQHNPFQNIVASSFTPAWNPITNFLSSHNLISRLMSHLRIFSSYLYLILMPNHQGTPISRFTYQRKLMGADSPRKSRGVRATRYDQSPNALKIRKRLREFL